MSQVTLSRISAAGQRPIAWIAAFTTLSWLGEFMHNRFELPRISPLSPENSGKTLLAVILFLIWWQMPARRLIVVLFLVLGILHLVGGAILSVLPLRFLPFYPEQSLEHHLMHIFYGPMQLPLIVALVLQVRHTPM